jgi:hypothetical protein
LPVARALSPHRPPKPGEQHADRHHPGLVVWSRMPVVSSCSSFDFSRAA